jgi:hypothetical protein
LQTGVTAQLTLQPVLPPTGMIAQSQLWNVLVVNSSSGVYNCTLKLVLSDRQTGQPVFTALTAPFTVDKGAKQVNTNILSPIQYNYISGVTNNTVSALLPAGSYTACYSLASTGKGDELAEQCVQFDAEPLSPPLLIFPSDSDRLPITPGQFSWTPPSPATMFNQLHYEILITEVREGQNANEALQQNVPFYSEGSLINNSMNYPGAATAFEKGKWYAWQVVARDDRQYAGKSDVHVFTIAGDSGKITLQPDIYLLLDDHSKGTYQLTNRKLNIKYFSFDKNYFGRILLSDEKGNTIKIKMSKILQGQNYFEIQLGSRFNSQSIYTVTIRDNKNKPHSLTFRLTK